jgi:hypothetical protein
MIPNYIVHARHLGPRVTRIWRIERINRIEPRRVKVPFAGPGFFGNTHSGCFSRRMEPYYETNKNQKNPGPSQGAIPPRGAIRVDPFKIRSIRVKPSVLDANCNGAESA